MTIDEICSAANRGDELPNNLPLHDALLFLSMRHVYRDYHQGATDMDTAKHEKQKLVYQHGLWSKRYEDYIVETHRYQCKTAAVEGIVTRFYKMLNDGASDAELVETAKELVAAFDGSTPKEAQT